MTPPNRTNPILHAWSATLRRRADDPAVRDVEGAVVRTFADIEAEARSVEEELAPAAGEGAVVAAQLGNSASWPAVVLALWRRGAVILPLGGGMKES